MGVQRSIGGILAGLGQELAVEIPEGETPASVAVVVTTVDAGGKRYLRTGGTPEWVPE